MRSDPCCAGLHRNLVVVLAVTLAAMTAGCQTAREANPLPAALFNDDPDTQLDFWHTLTERKVTTNDEAFHGILLYLDGKDSSKTFAERVQLLQSRKLVGRGFAATADQAVTRGTLAVALVHALNIKGGITMRLFGPGERYAVRELQYMGLFPLSSANQTFSGTEFVGIMGKIDDYQGGLVKATPAVQPVPGG